DARGRRVQDAEAVPLVRHRAEVPGEARSKRRNGRSVGPRQRALPDENHRALRRLQAVAELAAIHELRKRLRPGAEIAVRVGEIDVLTDQADREMAHAPAFADARVEDRRLLARI